MHCPRCQQQNPTSQKYCGECGTPLARPNEGDPPAASYADLQREVERLERTLTEALEQQTATAEILRVISSSPTDVQPVFDAIATAATTLCEADHAALFRFDGDLIHFVAHHGRTPEEISAAQRAFPQPPRQHSVTGRAILAAAVVQIADVSTDPELEDALRILRTVLSVPLMRDGRPLGAITVAHRVVRPFTDQQIALLQTFADQAVIAIENVRLFKELQEKNRALTQAHGQVTEALEQQTATSEVLKAISRSAFDLESVLRTLVENAVRLGGAEAGLIYRLEGGVFRPAADYATSPAIKAAVAQIPIPSGRGSVTGRAALERRTVHVADVLADPEYEASERQKKVGNRTTLAVPMQRAGALLGIFALWKTFVEPFTHRQVELVTTFADQAVIAIENVRLFKELEARNRDLTEALEQQTATSEILKVISASPTDLEPVLHAVVKSATRFCGAEDATIFQLDGDSLRADAHYGLVPHFPGQRLRVVRGTVAGRTVLERRTIHVADLQAEVEEFPEGSTLARQPGHRTILSAPLLRETTAIGVIQLRRAEVRPFADKQVSLLQTFADQAVIAIENVRLFKELEEKNRALTESHAQVTEALEQQTATSEILRVISESPTDVQPVFAAIAQSAMRLCDGHFCNVVRYDGDLLHLAAQAHVTAEGVEAMERIFPMRPSRTTVVGRVVLETAVVYLPDVQRDAEYNQPLAAAFRGRSALGVPLLRDGQPIGAIVVGRSEPHPFTQKQITLLQTFANQAVIAIENVRLFNETKEALEQQTATSEILSVIASSPTDVEPVFRTIVEGAVRLCAASLGAMYHYDGHLIRFGAHHGYTPAALELVHRVFPAPVEQTSLVGRAILNRRVVHVPAYDTEADIPDLARKFFEVVGTRGSLAVPMLRKGEPIGAIAVWRGESGPFADKQIALLQTFAAQAVIAIENVRLFKELEARNRDLTEALEQQTATSEILRVISSSPTDVRPTFDAIAASARSLCEAAHGMVFRFDGELIHLAAHDNLGPDQLDAIRSVFPIPPGRGSVTARAILTRALVHVRDRREDPELEYSILSANFPNTLSVPLLREGVPLGAITVTRAEIGLFSDRQIALLQTFADQAVIAIENVPVQGAAGEESGVDPSA